MKKAKYSRLKQNTNSDQSKHSSSTFKLLRTPYGTGRAQSVKKETNVLDDLEQEDSLPERRNKYQPLCLMERKIIGKMIKKGWSLSYIAQFLGRGKNSVVHEVRRNGGRDAYEPVKAQELAMQRKVERDIKCSKSSTGKEANPYVKLRERIENLEMQLEIVSETLKVLNRDKNN